MRPAASDYGLFGAGVQVYWLRQGGYANSGTFSSRTLDAGPGAAQWQTLTGAGRAAERHPDRLRHPLRRHPAARRQLVRVAARGRRRGDRQPGRALHPVPRPHGEHHRRVVADAEPRPDQLRRRRRPRARARAPSPSRRPRRRPTRRSRPRRAASATPTATRSPTTTAGCATARRSRAPPPPRSTCRWPGNGDRGDERARRGVRHGRQRRRERPGLPGRDRGQHHARPPAP